MDSEEFWPKHAYVPGKTARHPEEAFDVIRATAAADLSSNQLADCEAFRVGLRYLEAGYYWEAHELLEPVWMVLPEPSIERRFVQGLIQIANGYLKMKMDRPKAALRLVAIAGGLVPEINCGTIMGVEMRQIHGLIDSLQVQIDNAL